MLQRMRVSSWAWPLVVLVVASCGSDDKNEAQRHGVGSACTTDANCTEEGQRCLTFKGGYCGIADCIADSGCPNGSACVAHDDGKNYCFLVCTEKTQCNWNRGTDIESNCSANITFVGADQTRKACVPPTG
jgi:hypothetical protein